MNLLDQIHIKAEPYKLFRTIQWGNVSMQNFNGPLPCEELLARSGRTSRVGAPGKLVQVVRLPQLQEGTRQKSAVNRLYLVPN